MIPYKVLVRRDLMYQLCYISKSNVELNELKNEVDSILDTASNRNPKLGITGILMHRNTWFCQFIECDDESKLLELYGKICSDKRHKNITTIFYQYGLEQVFPDWSMVFKELDKEEDTQFINKIQAIADQNKLLTKSEVKKLLIDFRFYNDQLKKERVA